MNIFCSFMVQVVLVFQVLADSQLSIVFTSPPCCNSTVVTGGTAPIVTGIVNSTDLTLTSCGWYINGTNTQQFFTNTCNNLSETNYNSTCKGINATAFESSFYFTGYLNESLTVEMKCSLTYPMDSTTEQANIIVSDCPQNISSMSIIKPIVSARKFIYQSHGVFKCGSGQLFYVNETRGVKNTTCLNDATWYGQTGLECWTAPRPTLNGTFSMPAEKNIAFECSVAQATYPPVTSFTFFIGKSSTTTIISTWKTISSKEMNNKPVYCQAHSKYTNQNGSLGFSAKHVLNVTYIPFQIGDTKCHEFQNCVVFLSSNPRPEMIVLLKGSGKTEILTLTALNLTHYQVSFNKSAGDYTLLVKNAIGEVSIKISVLSNSTYTNKNYLPIIIGISVAGVLLAGFVILIFVLRKRRSRKSQREERDNPAYVVSPSNVDNIGDYATVNKDAKEVKTNILYGTTGAQSHFEDAHTEVDKGKKKTKSEKEVKMNILYGSPGTQSSQVEEAYAEVDRGKKKKKDKSKQIKVNVAYVPTPENPDAPEEAYAEVNKDKKKKGKKGEREMKDNILYGSSQAGGSVEDAYAEVDKKKKKNAGAKQGEASSGATYSEVSKPKNKKKDKPSSSQTPDDDPYAEVDLHGQDSSNLD